MTTIAESSAGRYTPADLKPSTYLTDGSRLFRVVRGFAWPPGQSEAVLEDCRTLEEHSFTAGELAGMRLRVVIAGETASIGEPSSED